MDGALVERARKGDADAFDELARQRIDSVYRTALGILGNPGDAHDATQEALISAWQQLPSLRDTDRFDGWLHRIAVNAAKMVARRRHGLREIRLTEPAGGAAGGDQPSASAFDRAFERLPVEQRAMLIDHHLDGRSLREMADRMAIPEGTLKSRLFAARQALNRALRELDQ